MRVACASPWSYLPHKPSLSPHTIPSSQVRDLLVNPFAYSTTVLTYSSQITP